MPAPAIAVELMLEFGIPGTCIGRQQLQAWEAQTIDAANAVPAMPRAQKVCLSSVEPTFLSLASFTLPSFCLRSLAEKQRDANLQAPFFGARGRQAMADPDEKERDWGVGGGGGDRFGVQSRGSSVAHVFL